MIRLYLSILGFWAISSLVFAQNPAGALESAFKAAKQSNKPLLVIRYEQLMVDYHNSYQNETDDSRLYAILNEAPNKQALANDYVVYWLNVDSLNSEEAQFQAQFLLYYTPNFIVFSSEGDLIHFYNPIVMPDDKIEVLGGLRDTLKAKEPDLQIRRSLQEKFDKKAITTPELLELVSRRTNAHLKSKEAFNELAVRKAEIPEELMEPILSQGFKTTDPLVGYILGDFKPKDVNWAYYKTYLVESVFENAKANKDKVEFENVLRLKGDYSSQAIEMASEAYPGTPIIDEGNSNRYLNEQLLSEKFDFYASISDTLNVKKYGNNYAEHVLNDYEKRKKEIVDNEMAIGEYMSNSLALSGDAKKDSVVLVIKAAYEKNKQLKRERAAQYFDKENASILNHISWAFYKDIAEKADLEKALAWSQKCTELEENAAYLDTYAHLLFKLGYIEKAIEYESKALELAAKIKGNDKYVKEFEAEINRFKKSRD